MRCHRGLIFVAFQSSGCQYLVASVDPRIAPPSCPPPPPPPHDSLYALDFARMFPPEPPRADGSQSLQYLVKLLRPELVLGSPRPLSSDAFSMFGRHSRV